MKKLIKEFSKTSLADIAEVGGKNASLGEMFTHLSAKGINIHNGFATTAMAFRLGSSDDDPCRARPGFQMVVLSKQWSRLNADGI